MQLILLFMNCILNTYVAYEVRITTFPDGSPVNGSSNTLEYPVGSNLYLICAVSPAPPANSQFSWSCETDCFADMKMRRIIFATKLNTVDSGSITCSLTINDVKYHSKPLHLQVV